MIAYPSKLAPEAKLRRFIVLPKILAILLLIATHSALLARTPPPALPELTYRTWTSAAGESIEAAFINIQQDQVILASRDEQRIAIPISRLIWRDQVMARRLSGRPVIDPRPPGSRMATRDRHEFEGRSIAAFGPACESLLLAAIQDTRHEILIAIYTLTSTTIAEALQEAAQRGVQIHIKYYAGQIETGRMSEHITNLGRLKNIQTTPIEMRGRFASMHHKFAVLDQSFVFTGSFNFTVTAATISHENALLIHSVGIANLFTLEFEAIESR
ncbi:MAG: phospholipase D-like domain-containing protein [Kiritimatiellia bacterium]